MCGWLIYGQNILLCNAIFQQIKFITSRTSFDNLYPCFININRFSAGGKIIFYMLYLFAVYNYIICTSA